MADDRAYRIFLQFDDEHERFYARVPELDLEEVGDTRADALTAAEAAIEAKFEAAAVDGESELPLPVDQSEVDGTIAIELAMPLARELAYHAARSKMAPATLAQQLLVRAIGSLSAGLRPPSKPRAEKAQDPGERREGEGTERPAGRKNRGRGRGRRGEGYRPEIEDQANFLAYVRDMEKGGGRRR